MSSFLFLMSCVVHAQTSQPSLETLEQAIQKGAESTEMVNEVLPEADDSYLQYRMEEETNRRMLALCVMGTAILVLLIVLGSLKSRQAAPETMVTGSGLVLVIFGTVLIVILAKADQQLTAAIGILGAIAGYLFGKTAK